MYDRRKLVAEWRRRAAEFERRAVRARWDCDFAAAEDLEAAAADYYEAALELELAAPVAA